MSMNAQEEEPHWENDPMWELLDEARTAEVDPFFVSKVMREVRLSSERTLPWWKVPMVVRPLLAGSMVTLVAILLIALSDDEFLSKGKRALLNWTPFLKRKCSHRQLKIPPLSVTRLWLQCSPSRL